MKKRRVRKPKENIFAHGAIHALRIQELPPPDDTFNGVQFGATSAFGDDYPVSFYGVENIRKLAAWLLKAADYLDAKKEGEKK